MKIKEALHSAENILFYIKEHSWQEIVSDVSDTYQIPEKKLLQMPATGRTRDMRSGTYRDMVEEVCSHVDEYIWLYDRLKDVMSRYVLWQLLCYRVAPDMTFIAAATEQKYKQYEDPDIIKYGDHEVVADCVGQTGILINGRNLDCGLCKSLDKSVQEPVTLIRVDGKGAEARILSGARMHMIHDRPRLAVNVGNLISSLWEIPRVIDEMMEEDCALYLRHYQKNQPCATVLYAVPSEQLLDNEPADDGNTMEDEDDRPNICVLPAFPLQNIQILKDRIVIPWLYYQHFGRSMTIATRIEENYPYLEYLEGAELHGLEYQDNETRGYENACCHYLLRNYKKIDILFLFGPYPQYIPIAPLYKFLRPDGKIYLKLDANSFWMDRLPVYDESYRQMLSSCDVISCESTKLQRLLSKKWPWRIEYIPNGYYDFFSVTSDPVPYEQKENRILTVGRIGTDQKNNEMLLEAFAKASDHLLKNGWKLRLVGKVENKFYDWVSRYFEQYPHLRDSVDITGPIYDKDKLFQEYRKAKLFVLTSRMEGGSPNVLSEALACCCVPVVTEIDGSGEATDEGRLGGVVPQEDPDSLARVLTDLCKDETRLRQESEKAWRYLHRHLDYDKIVERLDLLLRLS